MLEQTLVAGLPVCMPGLYGKAGLNDKGEIGFVLELQTDLAERRFYDFNVFSKKEDRQETALRDRRIDFMAQLRTSATRRLRWPCLEHRDPFLDNGRKPLNYLVSKQNLIHIPHVKHIYDAA